MSKKKGQVAAAEHETSAAEQMVKLTQEFTDEHGTKKLRITLANGDIKVIDAPSRRPGRPVDPNSKRQLEIASKGDRQGTGERGRPVDPNSARQQKIAADEKRRAGIVANGGVVKRGRPVDPNSKRQLQMGDKKEGTGLKGRPVDENSARQQKLREQAAKLLSGQA